MENNMKTQIAFWKILNYKNIIANNYAEHEDALMIADETEYFPVDENTCITLTDDACFLLTRSGTVLVNVDEIPYELVKDLK